MPRFDRPRRLYGLIVATAVTPAFAAPPNPVVVGEARFTVITPNLIRIEYRGGGSFVDAKSLFAVERKRLASDFKVTRSQDGTTIDTGAIRLVYHPDGKPLSGSNLSATVRGATGKWAPGTPNPGNLGGTIRTLDGVRYPVSLGEGVLSRDGWYLLDDSRTPLLTTDWVQSRPATAGTDWYLFGYGKDYKAALRSLTAVGGSVPLPRRYALGAWYSRYWPYSDADYRQIVQEYTSHDFPLDVMVLDMDWHRDGWTGWSWNRKLLPEPEKLLGWLHQEGLHATLNLHPADGVAPHEDAYETFTASMKGTPGETLPFDAGSKSYMDAMFSNVFAPLEKAGVDFWWLDWQQYPNTRSIPDLTNLFWLNTLLYDRTSQNDQRGLSFSRWAGWGDHRHPIHFSGDASTAWETLAFEVPFTATAGNVGCFFWSHDIGGHQGGRNEESYARWVQFGATSAALRSHSTRDATMDRRPWAYPKWAEDSMRKSFHLRSELFPYIYSSAWQSTHDSVPLNRPMYLDHPSEDWAYHNSQEFLFGPDLLVAPIAKPGVGPGRIAAQTVRFPEGNWYQLFTGERYTGGTDALVAADINEFPIFARGGVPMPRQPYTPRMAAHSPSTLIVRSYPGTAGSFKLYEDDGETQDYERGKSATTDLSYRAQPGKVVLSLGPTVGRYKGQPVTRTFVIELPNTVRAAGATVDGKPCPVSYDAETLTNRLTLPTRPIGKGATVVVRTNPADSARLHERAVARRLEGVMGGPVPNVRRTLADASVPMETRRALLEVLGAGYVTQNLGPYGYGGPTLASFYAPTGLIDQSQIRLTSGLPVQLDGTPFHLPVNTLNRRGHVFSQPDPIAFTIGGTAYQVPEPDPHAALYGADNVTATAKVTASGSQSGYSPEGAIDGILGGYPGNVRQEWSAGSGVGATLTLTWDTPQTVDRVLLFDRPNLVDQVVSGEVVFDDGTTLPVGPLPNDGKTPFELKFAAKTIRSLTFRATGLKTGSENAGLSEIAVMRVKTH